MFLPERQKPPMGPKGPRERIVLSIYYKTTTTKQLLQNNYYKTTTTNELLQMNYYKWTTTNDYIVNDLL
mgnify:CR=1 FL=1